MASLPPMHPRLSPRLQGFDYRQDDTYFITIVAANRERLFGDVVDDIAVPNSYGQIVTEEWLNLPKHFAAIHVLDFVVMPNHFHGIIAIDTPNSKLSVSQIMGGFKSGVSRRVNALRETPGAVVWQRSFYDRIVRNEEELVRIQQYIVENPLKWALDKENPDQK